MLQALPCLQQVDLFVDGLDDRFLTEYAAWPVRTFGIRCGVIEHISQPIGSSIHVVPSRRWLAEAVGSTDSSADLGPNRK